MRPALDSRRLHRLSFRGGVIDPVSADGGARGVPGSCVGHDDVARYGKRAPCALRHHERGVVARRRHAVWARHAASWKPGVNCLSETEEPSAAQPRSGQPPVRQGEHRVGHARRQRDRLFLAVRAGAKDVRDRGRVDGVELVDGRGPSICRHLRRRIHSDDRSIVVDTGAHSREEDRRDEGPAFRSGAVIQLGAAFRSAVGPIVTRGCEPASFRAAHRSDHQQRPEPPLVGATQCHRAGLVVQHEA